MKLNFAFKHLDRSEALEKYTKESLEGIGRFLLKDGYGSVYYSKTNHEFCVEVSVNTREKYFRAVALNSDPYQAVDAVMSKLEKQFLKTRKVVQNHKHPELSRTGKLDQMNGQFEVNLRMKKAA
ncbi:MAG: ribosome-associated translation inhibitor RaiA [Bdellovibrionaceae bacterium]|nr:ribosome-associated translation inhibitor RaiA [Pseudobdellovibrionaceae bacterium]